MLKDHPQDATILLSHSPREIERAADAGVDVMLSGHAHGGQIWPFNYLVKLRFPFLEGQYKIKNMNLIITSGAGTWARACVSGIPGEILRIKLHPKKKNTDKTDGVVVP